MKESEYQIKETLDMTTWNKFVLKYGPWSLFQCNEWGDVQKNIGLLVRNFCVYKGKDWIGAYQTALIKAKRGMHLHLRQGPVIIDSHLQDKKVWQAIFEHVTGLAKSYRAWFVRLNPMVPKSQNLSEIFLDLGLVPSPIHAMDAQYCWVLNLASNEEVLLSQMRKSTRYMIRQAQKNGVSINLSSNIKKFLELYRETSTRQNFVSHTGIEVEYEVFQKHNMAELLLASCEGEIISGALILYFGQQAIYHHGASLKSKTGASALLQWEAIRRAKNRNCKYYNFWGIAPEGSTNHPWKNITLFKTGFGGQAMEFESAFDLSISPLYKITSLIENARKIKRGYNSFGN